MHFDVGSTAPVPEAVFFHWLHRCRRTYLDDLIRVHLAQRRNGVLSRELAVITGDAVRPRSRPTAPATPPTPFTPPAQIHVLCEIARATVLRSNRGYLALPRTPAAIRAFETALRDALRPHQPLVADVVGVPQLEARLLPFEAAGQTGGGGDRGMEMGHAGHAPGDSDGSSSVGGGAKVPESTGDSTVPAPASGSSTGEGAYTGEERGDGPARGRHAALQDSAHAGGIEAEAPPRLERAPAEEEVARSAENAGVSSPDSDQGGLSQWDTSEHTFVRQREPEAQPVRSDANERKRRRASHSGDGGDGGAVDTAGRVGVEEPGRGHRAGETRPAAKRQRPETGPGPDAPPDGERQDSAGSAPASVSGAEDGWDSEEDDAASASGRGLRSSAAAQAISASDVVWSHPALHAAAFASLVDLNVPGTFRSLLDVPAPSWGAHPDSSPGGGGGSFADQPGATPAGLPARPAPTPAAATPAADPASEAWGGAQPGPDAAPPAEAEVWSTAGSDPGSVSTSIGEAGVMGSVIGPVPHVPPRTSEQWSLSPAQSADASRSMRELRLQLTQSLWRRCDYQDAKLKLIVNLFADEFALWGLLPRLKRVRKHDTQQLLYSMLVLLHPGDGDLVTALDNVRGKLLSTAFLAARGEIAAVMRDPRRRIQLAQSIIRDTPSQLVTAVARALSQKSKLADSVLRGLAEALKPVLGADAV